MPTIAPFHLAMLARDLDETIAFYTQLGAKLTYKSDEKWINIEWFGHQLTFHEKPVMQAQDENNFHWGFKLSLEDFEKLADKIRKTPDLEFELEPTVKDAGTDIERIKMYLKDPSGHLIEVKHFMNARL